MKKANLVYNAGELVTVSRGEYSDYGVNGLFRVLKAFNAQEQLLIWAKENNLDVDEKGIVRDEENFYLECISFEGFLNKNMFIEEMIYRELHTGDYGRFDLSDTLKGPKP